MQKKWKTGLAVAAGLLLALSVNAGLAGAEGCLNGHVVAYADEAEEFDIDENGVLIGYHGDGGDVVIPDGVTKIGDDAFAECQNLTSIVIPDGVTEIGYAAFAACINLENVEIPSSVEVIRTYAFTLCENLTSIIIPEGVTKIEDFAFDGCDNLVSIKIPDSLTNVGLYSLYGCNNLTNIDGKKLILDEEGVLVEYLPRFLSSPMGDVVIPDGVTAILSGFRREDGSGTDLVSLKASSSVKEIGSWAFALCDDLVEVEVSGVESIGECAFKSCRNLKEIRLSNRMTSIGEAAFAGCSSLTDITIPDGIAEIPRETFWGCTSLEKIKIPLSITSIDDYAFSMCDDLTDIYYAGTEEDWEKIEISLVDDGNVVLQNVVIHYNSTMPEESIPESPSTGESTDSDDESSEIPSENPGDTSIEEEPAPGTGDNMLFVAMVMALSMVILAVILLTGRKNQKA